jgi:20S proteasome subunit beta 3
VFGFCGRSVLSLSRSLSPNQFQEPDALFETVSQCLLAGMDRDALAGWGGVVYVITKDGCVARTLKGRMD